MLIRARRATVRLQPTGSRRLASSPPPPILGRGQREEEDDEEEAVGKSFHPPEWYRHTYPRLLKMSQALRRIDRVDGRVLRVEGGEESTVADARTIRALRSYAATARAFARRGPLRLEPVVFDSLTKVCGFLHIPSHRRKVARVEICRQIAHRHVWRSAIDQVLRDLGEAMASGCKDSKAFQMGQQIISCCSKFLKETGNSRSWDSAPLWRHLGSMKKAGDGYGKPEVMLRWVEVAGMFQDLTRCLKKEDRLFDQLAKVEAMKEGLFQMKEVVAGCEVGYNQVRQAESLVHRKLCTSLGHSSRCLFTLLVFYLYGSTRDIEVEACGPYRSVNGKGGVVVCVGKFLTSDDEGMVRRGVKQLDRALGVFKFVWEMAEMEGGLELQGHLWCVGGVEDRRFMYRGNDFFLHQLSLKA